MRKRNIRVGLYYSLYEWYHPLWKSDKAQFVEEHLFGQFKDLVTRYQPDVVWADGEWDLPWEQWRTDLGRKARMFWDVFMPNAQPCAGAPRGALRRDPPCAVWALSSNRAITRSGPDSTS